MPTADLPILARAHVDRGINHLKLRQYAEALARFDSALRLEPESSKVHVLRGRALARLGRFEDALAAINSALQYSPSDVVALSERGTVHVAMGRNDRALVDFDAAIQAGAKGAKHFFQRGAALFNLREWSRAAADFEVVLSQEKSSLAWFYRGLCRRQFGDHEGALADLAQAINADSSFADAHREYAHLLSSLGRNEQALPAASKLIKLCPKDTEALLLIAEIRQHAGDEEGAIQDYRRAIEIEPENVKALNGLAWLLATAGRDELRNGAQALAYAQRANELTGASDARILDTLAAARALCGDMAGSREALDRAIAIAPSDLKRELECRRDGLSSK